jgi:hypothetical protein
MYIALCNEIQPLCTIRRDTFTHYCQDSTNGCNAYTTRYAYLSLQHIHVGLLFNRDHHSYTPRNELLSHNLESLFLYDLLTRADNAEIPLS